MLGIPVSRFNTDARLDTLSMSDLVMQWKLMKALGYKSLFDPEFRNEIKNPVRRMLYYRVILEEERENRKFFLKAMENFSDKIGFFSDPELYRKYKEKENSISPDESKHLKEEYDKRAKYRITPKQAKEVSEILKGMA